MPAKSRQVVWAALFVGTLLLSVSSVSAATFKGLDVTVTAAPPGGGSGGYYPLQVSLHNRGEPHEIELVFAANYGRIPTVRRALHVEAERVNVCLLIPLTSNDNYGTLRVIVDGSDISQLAQNVSLPNLRSNDEQGPAVLVVGNRLIDWTSLTAALQSIYGSSAVTVPGSGYSTSYYGTTISVADDYGSLAAADLPRDWQAYTGLDLVFVSESELDALSDESRSAILKWVDAGGVLAVYNLTSTAARGDNIETAALAPLDAKLRLTGAFDASQAWRAEYGASGSGGSRFFLRNKLQGLLMVMPGDALADYDQYQWESVLNAVGRDRWSWTDRHGFSSRLPCRDFMEFLVPSVKGVPVLAFLILITVFSIVIGPVNYLYLWKQQRLYLLVVTIPLIALVTCLSLFGYSAVAHGFATRVRIRSLTMLDQQANKAVSTSRISLYSGLAPSDGLRFSRDSSVLPIWPPDGGFESGTVDWTQTQHFSSGWLRSRTRTQFQVTTHRDERGRIEVTSEANALSVANGLEWDLRLLVVADEQGRLFFGRNLEAGAAQRLEPLTTDHTLELIAQLGEHPPQVPSNYVASTGYDPYSYGYGYGYGAYGYAPPSYSMSKGYLERTLQYLRQPDTYVERSGIGRRYVALVESSPKIDIGVDEANEEASIHVLAGYY